MCPYFFLGQWRIIKINSSNSRHPYLNNLMGCDGEIESREAGRKAGRRHIKKTIPY